VEIEGSVGTNYYFVVNQSDWSQQWENRWWFKSDNCKIQRGYKYQTRKILINQQIFSKKEWNTFKAITRETSRQLTGKETRAILTKNPITKLGNLIDFREIERTSSWPICVLWKTHSCKYGLQNLELHGLRHIQWPSSRGKKTLIIFGFI